MRSQALTRRSTRKVVIPEAYIIEHVEQNRVKNAGLEWQISRVQPEPMPYWPEKKEDKAPEGLIIIEI